MVFVRDENKPSDAKKRRTIRMLPTIMDVEVKLSVMKQKYQ